MTEDEVKAVVRDVANYELCSLDFVSIDVRAPLADAIAARVAEQLAGRVGLSEEERDTLRWLKALASVGIMAHQIDAPSTRHSAKCVAAIALLDRLLGGKP